MSMASLHSLFKVVLILDPAGGLIWVLHQWLDGTFHTSYTHIALWPYPSLLGQLASIETERLDLVCHGSKNQYNPRAYFSEVTAGCS